ncbi:MAG: hypothetical protein KDK62_00715 [Chlamydiia bacterium]|nr:hypothetical protein [Chlamydiia bacterium]
MQPSERAYHILGALQSYAAHPEDQHIEVQDNRIRSVPGKKDPQILKTVVDISRIIHETEFEVSFNFRELKRDLEVLRENQKGLLGESKEVREAFEALSSLVTTKAQEAIKPSDKRDLKHISFDRLLLFVNEHPKDMAKRIGAADLSRFNDLQLQALSIPLMGEWEENEAKEFIGIFKLYTADGQKNLLEYHLQKPGAAFRLNFDDFSALSKQEITRVLTEALKQKETLTNEEFKKVMGDILSRKFTMPELAELAKELSRLQPIETFKQDYLQQNLSPEIRAFVILNTAKALPVDQSAKENVKVLIAALPPLDQLPQETKKAIFDELFRLDPIMALTNFKPFFINTSENFGYRSGDVFALLEGYLIQLENKTFDSKDAQLLIDKCVEYIGIDFRLNLAYRLMKFQPYETLVNMDRFLEKPDIPLVHSNYDPFVEAYRKALMAHPDRLDQIKRGASYVTSWGSDDVDAVNKRKDVYENRREILKRQEEEKQASDIAAKNFLRERQLARIVFPNYQENTGPQEYDPNSEAEIVKRQCFDALHHVEILMSTNLSEAETKQLKESAQLFLSKVIDLVDAHSQRTFSSERPSMFGDIFAYAMPSTETPQIDWPVVARLSEVLLNLVATPEELHSGYKIFDQRFIEHVVEDLETSLYVLRESKELSSYTKEFNDEVLEKLRERFPTSYIQDVLKYNEDYITHPTLSEKVNKAILNLVKLIYPSESEAKDFMNRKNILGGGLNPPPSMNHNYLYVK